MQLGAVHSSQKLELLRKQALRSCNFQACFPMQLFPNYTQKHVPVYLCPRLIARTVLATEPTTCDHVLFQTIACGVGKLMAGHLFLCF